MTTIATIGDLIDHEMTMTAHCRCGHCADVDLVAAGARIGRNALFVAPSRLPLVCGACGRRDVSITIASRKVPRRP